VGTLTRVALGAVVVAAVAVAGVLLVGRSDSPPALEPAAPLSVHAGFEPATAPFGDRVTARAVALLDRSVVRPDTLKLAVSVAPLTQLGPVRTTRTNRGRLAIVSVEVPAACVTAACVARPGDTSIVLPRVTAVVAKRGGGFLHAAANWPTFDVHGRVNASDIGAARPPFRSDTTPSAPAYRIAPSTLAALLDALAVVLVLAGVAVAALEVRRLVLRRRGRAATGSELERALRLAREAESRPSPDRRRAVGLLARLLGPRDDRLAGEASDLAWARPQPEPDDVSGLVSEIEREVVS
jgi:hypothetical protein